MIPFADFLNSVDKKNRLDVVSTMAQHPTGFMYLDYGVGSNMIVYDDDECPLFNYHSIGITSGSVNVLISKSQGGKTTLAIQMGMAIIEPYINKFLMKKTMELNKSSNTKKKDVEESSKGLPFIQILDTEKTLPVDYVKRLTKYKNKMLANHVTINPISTDRDVMNAIEQHVKYKVENMAIEEAPMRDIYNKPVYEYPPTIIIIDSCSQLILEDCDDLSKAGKKGGIVDMYENAIQGTAGARRAKVISQLYSQMVNYAKRYNIIIFSINHINKMTAIMGVPVKQYRGLRVGETIGGGERAIYLAANILRLDVIKSIGGESSTSLNIGEGITGHISIAKWIKSKSNSKGNECQLAYTGINGYDPLLSTLYFAKEKNELPKAGNFYYINKYPEYKFSFKNYSEVFAEHPELFSAYYDQFRDTCAKMLDDPEKAARKNNELMNDIRNDIRNDVSNGDYDRATANDIDDLIAMTMND